MTKQLLNRADVLSDVPTVGLPDGACQARTASVRRGPSRARRVGWRGESPRPGASKGVCVECNEINALRHGSAYLPFRGFGEGKSQFVPQPIRARGRSRWRSKYLGE